MTYSNISSLTLGNILQIAFSKGVRQQISEDFRDFEMVKRAKVAGSLPRELRFFFQNGLSPSNIQWRNPGTTNRAFPRAFQPSTAEYTATMKEVNSSVELEYQLYDRAKKNPQKYAEPLQMVLSAAMTSSKREIARALYKDGTGVIGQLGADAAAVTSPASNSLVFTLDEGDSSRGHVGDFEYDEIYILRDTDASATALDTSLATEPAYWKCIEKNREAGTVKLQGLDSNFDPVASISSISVQPASGAVFYKYDQPTIPDISGSITSYSSLTETVCGLESLAATDGRSVHGITMSGRTGASAKDCGGAALDLSHFNSALDQAKVAVGQDRYRYKMANCSPEAQSALIESREGDRRLQVRDNAQVGSKSFGIVHRNDFVELNDSEFVHPKRIWILPESKAGEKVIEYHGSDFEAVKTPGGDDWHLKVSNSAYVNSMVNYMQATAVFICKHPKSIVKIHDFV